MLIAPNKRQALQAYADIHRLRLCDVHDAWIADELQIVATLDGIELRPMDGPSSAQEPGPIYRRGPA